MGPSPAARRFDARLRLLLALRGAISGFDLSDVILIASLTFIFVGFAAPSAAFGVVGFLLIPLTPIWTNIRLLIRGR
jgi:hypothetical protein